MDGRRSRWRGGDEGAALTTSCRQASSSPPSPATDFRIRRQAGPRRGGVPSLRRAVGLRSTGVAHRTVHWAVWAVSHSLWRNAAPPIRPAAEPRAPTGTRIAGHHHTTQQPRFVHRVSSSHIADQVEFAQQRGNGLVGPVAAARRPNPPDRNGPPPSAVGYQPRVLHSPRCGRSAPSVESLPWPG